MYQHNTYRLAALRHLLFSLWLIVVLTGIAGAQSAPAATPQFDPARNVIRQFMAEKHIPSVSLAVAKNGKIIWEESFGWADRERMVRATPDTLYSLASISKSFTATGMMKLVEQGKVDLNKPANDYLGATKITGLAGDPAEATVKRVMSHTAGLPYHYHFFYVNEPDPVPGMDESIAHYGIIVTPPGEAYEYSNLGYGIIDYIMSRVSGRDYSDYMRDEVFLPLGLTHTSVDIAPGLEPYVAQRYDDKQQPIPFYTFDHRGGSAVYSSAHDLIRFAMFHLKDHLSNQQAILKDSTIDEMHQPLTPPVPKMPGLGYGLGWITNSSDHGYKLVYHTGGMPGVATAVALYPSEDMAVVMLSNYYAGLTPKMMRAIVGCVLPKYAAAVANDKELAKQDNPPKPSPFTPTPELLGQWSGTVRTWEKQIPFTMSFQPDGDIHVRFGDELETLVNNATYQDGLLEGRLGGEMPTPDAMRHKHGLEIHMRLRGNRLEGQLIAETPDDSPHFALSSYVQLTRTTAAAK